MTGTLPSVHVPTLVLHRTGALVFGSEIAFADRGTHELKGVPGQWQLLADARDGAPRLLADARVVKRQVRAGRFGTVTS